MSDPKMEIALWAGIPLLVVGVFYMFLDDSAGITRQAKKIDSDYKQYQQYYLGAGTHSGTMIPYSLAYDNALTDLSQQQHETASALQLLAPALPRAYSSESNYTQASSRVTEDLAAVRKLAARSSVEIPERNNFESSLAVEPAIYSKELAYLRLYRAAHELLITESSPGRLQILDVKKKGTGPYCDTSKSVAVFQMMFTVEIGFRRLERVLRLLDHNKKGLCLSACEIEAVDTGNIDNAPDSGSAGAVKVVLQLSLMTPYRELWDLQEDTSRVQEDAGGNTTGRNATRRGGRRGSRR